ncbi:MAG TPA: hypothetical protein VGJ21_07220 [Terracidiphilus sp.]
MNARDGFALRLFLALCFSLAVHPAKAQDQCGFGSEDAATKLEDSLRKAPSCKAAAKLFDECRWGSSADVGFGGIVAEKCTHEYLAKLTKTQKTVHDERMELCNYEYEHQDGTLAISELTACHIEVAVEFAANPAKASTPLPRSSFDCSRAVTPLEKAICSDTKLGRADLILSRVYSSGVKSATGDDKVALVQSERTWLREIPRRCGLSVSLPSSKTLACLRDQFEMRFDLIDGCSEGLDFAQCLTPAQ